MLATAVIPARSGFKGLPRKSIKPPIDKHSFSGLWLNSRDKRKNLSKDLYDSFMKRESYKLIEKNY